MCGILAYFNPNGVSKIEVEQALASLKSIKHRGPDGEGVVLINTKTGSSKTLLTEDLPSGINWDIQLQDFYGEYHLILGHRRLSIFDTSIKGHQPMLDNSTGNMIVYNGEVYNFFELKDELKNLGHQFHSETDTEVILAAYKEWGGECFNKFNGMWSIVIWLADQKSLVVSNDRFGVKPLYHLTNRNVSVFVSEHKQIQAFKQIETNLDYDQIKIFLENGILNHDQNTFFKELKKFPSSNYGKFNCETNEFSTTQYYRIEDTKEVEYSDPYGKFIELFSDAISIRTRADVNWGVGLSGGLDSSSIIYGLEKILRHDSVVSFSAIFPGLEGDESHFIKAIEKDLQHEAKYINPLDSFNLDAFKELIHYMDVPVPSTAYFAQWKVAELAKKNNTKVFLVGQGADEIFAGYHHHFYKFLSQNMLSLNLWKVHKESKSYALLKGKKQSELLKLALLGSLGSLKSGPIKPTDSITSKWAKSMDLKSIQMLDFQETMLPFYLHSDDRTGMSHGVESRHPFMDYRLVEFAFSLKSNLKINAGWQKWIIRKSFENILPNEICWRKDKKGFSNPQHTFMDQLRNESGELSRNVKEKMPFEIYQPDDFRLISLGTWLSNFDSI